MWVRLVSIADAFAGIATAFSRAGLGAFHDSTASWAGVPVTDDGGSIVSPGDPVTLPCSCQVDVVTDAMRAEAGFVDRDVRLLVLRSTLTRPLDTDATITVLAGPSAGVYSVQSATLDPIGSHWDCRGRRA